MRKPTPRIIYTKTDEAPSLATESLLPIIQKFLASSGIELEQKNISLGHRVLAAFPEYLNESQRVNDDLALLGKLVKQPEANIIKLPNISASAPQLKATITELQNAGFALPDYPENVTTEKEHAIRERYNKIKGSAVNPVLREGNSDRRTAKAVKAYAQHHPHQMGAWSSNSKTEVYSMSSGDFFETEKSVTLSADDRLSIVFSSSKGEEILKSDIQVKAGEIVDSAVLQKASLKSYIRKAIAKADASNLLLSAHLKATMMKISDPIIFGHIVSTYFEDVFNQYANTFKELGVNPNNGLKNLLLALDRLDDGQGEEIKTAIKNRLEQGPDLAMVDSDKGITNLHVPSDVIIDASMPAMIRNSGKMWDNCGKSRDTIAMIPDRSYSSIYDEAISFCKLNGAFDPATMGSVSNIGLMAQKAEEYGSHDKTFEISTKGQVIVRDQNGQDLMIQAVSEGDIFRVCQVSNEAIKDWVALAIRRAQITKDPAYFWLDKNRAHDQEVRKKVAALLKAHLTEELDIQILDTRLAIRKTLERTKSGLNTISVTGNVLRDYITDLFPILELGTSAKMLSIVPLMKGGGLFETGAGGSAPKHVQQLLEENHLRWDSLGEFLALGVSLEHLAQAFDKPAAKLLAETLSNAVSALLENGKSPSRRLGEIDNRGSHFYLARYWAKELAQQSKNKQLAEEFSALSQQLETKADVIEQELLVVQGKPADIGGYYYPNNDLVQKVMRPSNTLNRIID